MPPSLIAVIGPVETTLLHAWVDHYRALGVRDFHLALHLPEHAPQGSEQRLRETLDRLGVTPVLVEHGPWHETTNASLRDRLRAHADAEWHLIADSDEFHTFATSLDGTVTAAKTAGHTVVRGLMLDRVTRTGHLNGWHPPEAETTGEDPRARLDAAYPLGGWLTHRLLLADPRKIVLARSGVTVSSGNHRAPGHHPAHGPVAVVHHFKWRHGIDADLRRRIDRFASGAWTETSPAVRHEAARLLEHLRQNGGRIDTADPVLRFRPVTLDRTPPGWQGEAHRILTRWRPAHAETNPER
ncbi:glycosyltransferase family 2 protein [Nocardiopsis sp. CNS-639]|uniref:glycosyltransferase family 2 protein n=1 Tax=Nocardiopsis sp. CNS-639 TaxID=1169153 RepID=UPI000372CC54|nr:glycosyltransferase family 2 protein [Nocardiopsis sp. CNS-639]